MPVVLTDSGLFFGTKYLNEDHMKFLRLLIILAIPLSVNTQPLLEISRHDITLSDGKIVSILAHKDCQNCFYYTPTNFRIARKEDGTPEVSLITWMNEAQTTVEGGILHMLTVWGLTNEQESELQKALITNVDSSAVLLGAVLAEVANDKVHINISGEGELAELLRKSLNSQSQVATMPGSKMAMSFRFDGQGAKRLIDIIQKNEKAETEFTIELDYMVSSEYSAIGRKKTVTLRVSLDDVLHLFKQ
jgi:hypothetical protein